MKKVKLNKIIAICILLSMFLLVCCDSTKNIENADTKNNNYIESSVVNETYGKDQELLDKIVENGEITIGMDCSLEPFSYYEDENNDLVGYDVEVGKEIAKKLGINANFIECNSKDLFSRLSNENYDIIMNGIFVNDEIKKDFDYTNPYAYATISIIVNDDNDDISKFDDLKNKKVSIINGSIYEDIAKKYGAKVIMANDLYQSIDKLLQNEVDSTINSTYTFNAYKKTHIDENIKSIVASDNKYAIVILIRKGNKSLLDKLNNILDDLDKDGTLKKLSEKYFDTNADLT